MEVIVRKTVLCFGAACNCVAWGEAAVQLGYLCRETTSSGLLTAVEKVARYLSLARYTRTKLGVEGIKIVLTGTRLGT
jgi:hypothetical protein